MLTMLTMQTHIGFSFTQPDEPVILQLHTYKCITQCFSYDYIIDKHYYHVIILQVMLTGMLAHAIFAYNMFAYNVNRQTRIPGSC